MVEPQDFLATLKHQLHGYVADHEAELIDKLQRLRNIPNSVINMVIWLSLAKERQPQLRERFVDACVNAWLQAGVTNAAEAMARIELREAERQRRALSGYSAPVQSTVGQVPAWANDKFTEAVPEAEMAALEERFKKLSQE
jgi:replication initiation and membrane attachment protein DnaB